MNAPVAADVLSRLKAVLGPGPAVAPFHQLGRQALGILAPAAGTQHGLQARQHIGGDGGVHGASLAGGPAPGQRRLGQGFVQLGQAFARRLQVRGDRRVVRSRGGEAFGQGQSLAEEVPGAAPDNASIATDLKATRERLAELDEALS